jgi:hypothetical protein
MGGREDRRFLFLHLSASFKNLFTFKEPTWKLMFSNSLSQRLEVNHMMSRRSLYPV